MMSHTDEAAKAAALQKAKALSRWEGEGGALAPTVTLDEADMRVLARLGAALLLDWDAVPESNRDVIFRTASTLHAERDAIRIRREIARFMQDHKDR